MIGKDKISDKTRMDVEMVTEEELILDKTLVEVIAEFEAGKTLGETLIIMIGTDQEEEAPHPEGTSPDDIIAQVQIQDLGVDQTLGVTTNRDIIRCFRCREYDHFANECPNTGIEDSDGYDSDSDSIAIDGDRYRNS